jgi:uncharacterized protein
MLNYEVDPELLRPYTPAGTVVDSFLGKTYVSLVGFQFCQTRLLGSLPVPFHTDFTEVNLRFYVRRDWSSENRRGVVFISEIVPKRLIAAVARLMYGEKYVRLPMASTVTSNGQARTLQYRWKIGAHWCQLTAESNGPPEPLQQDSLEQFITEHYWGYTTLKNGGSMEYRVEHPAWRVWSNIETVFEGDSTPLYGPDLGKLLLGQPASAFIAEGSAVTIRRGKTLC